MTTMSSLQSGLPPVPDAPISVGISGCLLGEPVRFDGGHKRSSLCHDELAGLFEYAPHCPEVAIGLPTPREPIRLTGGGEQQARSLDAVSVSDSGKRYGSALRSNAQVVARDHPQLCGYLLMKNSPSCGLFRVKRWQAGSKVPRRDGRGVFAEELLRLKPSLPAEESGRLFDPVLRENFVTRVFAFAHFQSLMNAGVSARGLIEFHSQYKLLIMAHSPTAPVALGRLLSQLDKQPLELTAETYLTALMRTLRQPADRSGHANVLQHLMGVVSKSLASRARASLSESILSYHRGEAPLLAPLTLLTHHLVDNDCHDALKQRYLSPHPAWAGLRRTL